MTNLAGVDLVTLAQSAGLTGPAAVTAAAIALAESGGNPNALGDKNNPAPGCASYGLWQINYCPARDAGTIRQQVAQNPGNVQLNAQAMATISNHGRSFTPWTTYRDNAYKKYLSSSGLLLDAGDGTQGTPTNNSQGISGAIGAAVSGPATAAASTIGSITDVLGLLTDKSTWLKAAYFVLGLMAVVFAFVLIERDTIAEGAAVAAL